MYHWSTRIHIRQLERKAPLLVTSGEKRSVLPYATANRSKTMPLAVNSCICTFCRATSAFLRNERHEAFQWTYARLVTWSADRRNIEIFLGITLRRERQMPVQYVMVQRQTTATKRPITIEAKRMHCKDQPWNRERERHSNDYLVIAMMMRKGWWAMVKTNIEKGMP